MKTTHVIAVALLAAALAGGGAFLLARRDPSHDVAGAGQTYQCPMHPSIVEDHPGDCPICGMKLVEVEQASPAPAERAHEAHEGIPGLAAVDIDPARQQLIGLRTVEVTRGPVGGAWRTVGRVAVDETRVRIVSLKVSGFVERVHVDFVGKKVDKGDALLSIYSPELLSAQEEYLLALRTRDALTRAGGGNDGDDLVAAARRKLALWDVPAGDVDRLARTGEPTKALTFRSPIAGVVTRKDVVQGMKLDAGAMPYEIVDLSSVWVLADVYESELRFVEEGMGATIALRAIPDRTFQGKVVFIDPVLDPTTRTVKVRLTFPNPDGDLRPGLFGEVILRGTARDGLRIPPDAVIDSGTEKVVFVAVGDGKFEPRRVELGAGDGAHVEVVGGLDAGERVVTRANFLVDSESRLRASLAAMAGDAARVLPDHGGHAP